MIFPPELVLPQKTIFRKGGASDLGGEACRFGARGLLVHGPSLERNGAKEAILRRFPAGSKVGSFCRGKGEPASPVGNRHQRGEPTLDEISRVIAEARALDADWIAGVGGGSVLDLAKAAAGLYLSLIHI